MYVGQQPASDSVTKLQKQFNVEMYQRAQQQQEQ